MFNYSFWDDEAYISSTAKLITQGKIPIMTALNFVGITYQRLYVLIISVSFKLFGISEFTARLPSMVLFIFGIIVMFFLAKRLSNTHGGFISSFIYTFSHLNLAYATQAKPYSILETILLINLLLYSYLKTEKKYVKILLYNFLIVSLSTTATFLHNIGILFWLFYFVYLATCLKSIKIFNIKQAKNHIMMVLVFILIAIVAIPIIVPIINARSFFQSNNLYQVTKLFVYRYFLITVSAFFGYFWSIKERKINSFGIFLYTFILLIAASFVSSVFNIRYVLTAFGIMFLYFGIFWGKVGEKFKKNFKFAIFGFPFNGQILATVLVLLFFMITQYKVAVTPRNYYNPNIDKYGDVQIANYKDFYGKLKQKFPNYKNIIIFNDTFDAEGWYFGRYSNAYFMKFVKTPYKHPVVNTVVYGTLSDFKNEMSKSPNGLLIVEDWQSYLPDDIKDYAKKSLKLEFRVESLKEAPSDPWPLALYSWGFN